MSDATRTHGPLAPPNSATEWNERISAAIQTADPLLSNFRITRLHFMLSRELENVIGSQAGANFHSWAVWGSRKAGVTIRQEDKDQASRDALIVAGLVGAVVGLGVGWWFASSFGWPRTASLLGWTIVGGITGGGCGLLLATYTRSAAARLILEGNRIVLDDIGRETARYLDYVQAVTAKESADDEQLFAAFLARFRPGPTDQGGQQLLHDAFQQYEQARRSGDPKTQNECNYFANCLAVLHEHIRLQPYIHKSMPFLIRKCVTQRLMTYSVGEQQLAVHEDVPPLSDVHFPKYLQSIESPDLRDFLDGPQGWDVGRGKLQDTRASDWTQIRERMGYIVNLFRTRHAEPDVVASPYSEDQFRAIANGELPPRPW